jgi:phospholipid/cholesterol/gamma-HCH transport system substrate-binding protein
MSKRDLIVGLFMIVGFGLLATGVIVVGSQQRVFGKHVDYYTTFGDVDGLTKGSKVEVAGLNAGEVTDIHVLKPPALGFSVTLRVDRKLQGLVRTDSIVAIETQGVVGETFLSIQPGSPNAAQANPGATLQSQEMVSLSEMLNRGSRVLDTVDSTVKVTSAKLNGALDELSGAVSNANDLVAGLKEGRGTVGMLLQDQGVAGQIRRAITQTEDVTTNLDHVSTQAESLMSDFQSRQLPQNIDQTVNHMKSAAVTIDDTARQIHTTVTDLSQPDDEGVSLADNVRESLSQSNAATANLEADTEALKHNFLLRGFFRRRGYYNLRDLQPDRYRKDKVFMRPENARAWLPASDLFHKTANGNEALSSAGELFLDAQLAEYGNAVVEQPIVVEGYSNSPDVAEQLSDSRQRAILIRQYLFIHYALDLTKVGIVSMRNSPPPGSGHASWDGVCLVIVR